MDILNKLQEVFRDIFDDEDIVIARETSSNDIEGWDSFAQVNIIATCESEFGIKFDLSDIKNLKNVGDIVETIERKLN
ncbi:MAG: acyl carrier protein [Synergistaceae bacterium]|nr:acyl carrier protein [Synergistaceae bacterium]